MLPCLFLAFESKKIVKCVQGTQKFIIFATNIHLVNKVMAITITIIALIAIFIVAWFMGLNANLGIAILDNCFPTTYPCKGEQVDVYINGSWNRCATVTACCHDFLVLYGAVRCPIDYRGRFYAIGVDSDQKYIAPDVIIASMKKEVGTSIFDAVSKFVDGDDSQLGTTWVADMATGYIGIGYGDDDMPQQVPDEVKDAISGIAQKIIDGEIVVETTRS